MGYKGPVFKAYVHQLHVCIYIHIYIYADQQVALERLT